MTRTTLGQMIILAFAAGVFCAQMAPWVQLAWPLLFLPSALGIDGRAVAAVQRWQSKRRARAVWR